MKITRRSRCCKFLVVVLLPLSVATVAGSGNIAQAQIIPDGTLGEESSMVTPLNGQADRIDGGAARGSNLFHSFREFNINEGRGAYFANPAAIENIFSRVTGSNPSRLFGTLGVLGDANLFFLNPNGIIFGPNSSLDVRGSFFASTASTLKLPDGTEFSVTNPEAPPLLTVDVKPPIGLLFEESGAFITNEGNLAAGQDLSLEAGNLDLQGQLKAERNLTLKAQDTVSLRDSATQPFKAEAGGELLVQGARAIDLSDLMNIESELFSGRDMVFRSPNRSLSSNAVYTTGGIFRTEQLDGNVVDFIIPHAHDRVIRNNGDVTRQDCPGQDCSGSSLIILAGGNVTLGDVKIENSPPESRANQYIASDNVTFNSSTARFTLADRQNTISVRSKDRPALYIRAGNDLRNLPGLLSGNTTPNNVNSATNGNITVGSIDTSSLSLSGDAKDGGAIALDAIGDISTADLESSSRSRAQGGNAGNGGNIALSAGGDISTADLESSSSTFRGNARNGGNIALTADGDISTGNLESRSSPFRGDAGNGGNIALSAGGDIDISIGPLGGSSSFTLEGDAGNGGNIALSAGGDIDISTDTLYSISITLFGDARNGGNISLTAGGDISTGDLSSDSSSFRGDAGNGGNIALLAGGDISTGVLFSGSQTVEGNGGNGGAIALSAGGDIETEFLASFSLSDFKNEENGGAIALSAGGDIKTEYLASFSYSDRGNVGDGGAITFTAGGDISTGDLFSFSGSKTGDAGDGGAITLTARDGDIVGISSPTVPTVPTFASWSASENGTAGNGGNVILKAKGNVTDLEILTLSSDSESGTVEVELTGFGDLSVTNTSAITSKQLTVETDFTGIITLNLRKKGQSGEVCVTSNGNLSFNDSFIESDTIGSDDAGDVNITSLGSITFNNSSIESDSSSKGDAGRISLSADKEITFADSNSGLSAEASDAGAAGSITVNTPELTLQQNARISTSTTGAGKAGDITLNTPILNLVSGGKVLASTSGSGDGGKIIVNAPKEVNLGIGVQDFVPIISVETSGAGKAGDIEVTTPTLTLSDTARITAIATETATNPEGGGSISLNASKMDLAGIVGVFAETKGESEAGTLRLQPDNNKPTLDLTLAPGAKISASTSASGDGGNLIVSAPEAINISGPGELAVETTDTGDAGKIELATQKLTLSDGVKISASTSGGAGGTIEVEADTFDARDGAKLITTTSGESNAGSIILNVSDNITLAGDNTELLANTDRDSKGKGGNIIIGKIIAPRTVIIRDGARIAVDSEGKGKGGGNIEIFSGSLTLDNRGQISAKTFSTDGGNITLQIDDDPLLLRRNSLISATAGIARDSGNGGNIIINAPFIIAFPSENSDITANAFKGDGGNIKIAANAIFGIEERKAIPGNRTNDIDASSEFGQEGVVEIETLIDPTRGLTNLPEEPVDPEVAEGCQAEAGEPDVASFYDIGRGGLPPRPDEPLSIEALIVPLIPFDVEGEDKTVQTREEIFSISEMKGKFFLTPACRAK